MKLISFVSTALLLIPASIFAHTTIEGKVQNLDHDNKTVVIRDVDTGNLHMIGINENTSIVVSRKKTRDLSALNIGETVIYEKGKISKKVGLINAQIEEVDRENQRLTFIDAETGEQKTVPFHDDVMHGSGFGEIGAEDLRPGQHVVLEVVKR